ncbi:MAG: hypothetical protein H6738_09385 [Alphaproteobacteria bacterium]|nr:hypothetical protein [Alphaproteobacteria bacterium]
MWIWCVGAALAATPNPDRPSVSRSGFLVAADTLELELGVAWADSRSVPTTLKYAIGEWVEPRVSANLSGVEAGLPALEAGTKIRLVDDGDQGFALWAGSAVPVSTEEGWYGQLHGLYTTGLGHGFGLQLNGGVGVVGDGAGGVDFGGVPLVGALSVAPTRKLSLFAEVAGRVVGPGCDGATCAYGNVVVDGGIGFLLTEILLVDGGAGWDLAAQQPYAQLGLTANFGSIR